MENIIDFKEEEVSLTFSLEVRTIKNITIPVGLLSFKNGVILDRLLDILIVMEELTDRFLKPDDLDRVPSYRLDSYEQYLLEGIGYIEATLNYSGSFADAEVVAFSETLKFLQSEIHQYFLDQRFHLSTLNTRGNVFSKHEPLKTSLLAATFTYKGVDKMVTEVVLKDKVYEGIDTKDRYFQNYSYDSPNPRVDFSRNLVKSLKETLLKIKEFKEKRESAKNNLLEHID